MSQKVLVAGTGLRPSAELEMMMDRRHLEKALSARLLKIGYLNNNR